MSREAIINAANQPPQPAIEKHNAGSNGSDYCCHSAAMHWGFISLGESGNSANNIINLLSSAICQACSSKTYEGETGLHGTISNEWYGHNVCENDAIQIGSLRDFENVRPGDVLISGNASAPSHSMIVVNKSNNQINIRGFNNQGTFPFDGAPRAAYDPYDRDVSSSSNWTDENGFGPYGANLYYIPYEKFAAKIALIKRRAGLIELKKSYPGVR